MFGGTKRVSFLDCTPDLSETRFSEERLDAAREFWSGALEAHAPDWLEHPSGPLAVQWTEPVNGIETRTGDNY